MYPSFTMVTSCSGALLGITAGISQQTNRSLIDDFVRGFVDSYFGRPHCDGIYPSHRLEVCVPTGNPYRDGWIAGKVALQSNK
jgi:hypothetical protein